MANEENLKTLKTRIKLRYDSYNNWKTQNPILLSGEVAIVAVAMNETPDKDISTTDNQTKDLNLIKPAILFKVGDHSTRFNDLPWASGMAADVYNWAKKAKPDYNDLINTPTIPVDTNTTYQIIQGSETGLFKLQKQEKGSDQWINVGNEFGTDEGAIKELITDAASAASAAQTTADNAYNLANGKQSPATTLDGYGITDAKIVNGTITLGGNTITPITSHQDLSNYASLNYVDQKVAGAVQYLGLINSEEALKNLPTSTVNKIGKGDFWRAGQDFSMDTQDEPATVIYKNSNNHLDITFTNLGTAKIQQIIIWDTDHNDRKLETIDVNGDKHFYTSHTLSTDYTYNLEYKYDNRQSVFSQQFIISEFNIPVTTTISAPSGYIIPDTSIHANDILVSAQDKPHAIIGSTGYYVVHGEEIGVTGIISGNGITVVNGNTATPTISHAQIAVATSEEKNSRKYINGLTFDGMGHITGYTTHTETDQAHQSIKTLDTTSTTALKINGAEAITGSEKIQLHQISKTGKILDASDVYTISITQQQFLDLEKGNPLRLSVPSDDNLPSYTIISLKWNYETIYLWHEKFTMGGHWSNSTYEAWFNITNNTLSISKHPEYQVIDGGAAGTWLN